MLAITKDQARQRFSTISPRLQDAIFSPQTAEIISQIAAKNNLSEEKTAKIANIAGWVLLGFMHAEDVAKELQDAAGMPAQTAAEVTKALDAKIFQPFQNDLQKIYAPALHKEEVGVGPKMMGDLTAPEVMSQTMRGGLSIGAMPIAGNQGKAAPPPAAPHKLPDIGWSRSTPEEPVVKLSETRPAPPQPPAAHTASGTPAAMPQGPKPAMPSGPMGEFERMNLAQPKPSAAAPTTMAPKAPEPAAKSNEPAPVMLHEDSSFKATPKAPDFHIQMPADKFGQEKSAMPVRSAMMELGKTTPPGAPGSPTSAPVKVVHYTEYKPSTPSTPASSSPHPPIPAPSQGPRQVTEFTGAASAPAPSTPPPARPNMPPPPPSMPKPPSPSAGPAAAPTSQKVVFKNYSEAPSPSGSPPSSTPPPPPSPHYP